MAESDRSISRFVEAFAKSDDIRILETIVEILDLMAPVAGVEEKLNRLFSRIQGLSSFSMVLQKGSTESKVKSARLLELISVNSESLRRISEAPGLLRELCSLATVESNNSSAVEASFSALLAVSSIRAVKKELVRFGIVKTVGKILFGFDYSAPVRAAVEKALAVLADVATCTEGRGSIVEDGECVEGVVRRLIRCSGVATEHGVTVLWSVCCLARDISAQEKLARVDGLTKVLLVMQSDCSPNARQMCRELVKVVKPKCSKSNLAPYGARTDFIAPY